MTVDVNFTGIKDQKTGEIFNAVYQYTATPGQGGQLQYAADQDNYPDPGNTGSAKEHATLRSRWQQDGTGRSDFENSGGDLGAVVGHAHYGVDWIKIYLTEDYDTMAGWGAETSCTAFPTPDYSSL